MEKKTTLTYKFIKWLVRTLYPKTELVGAERLPDGPCIVVGNHAQTNGPIACELYFPGEHFTWCAGEMMHRETVQAYAFRDFWSQKPRSVRWFFKLASYLIVPLAVCVFNNANAIGVYHDARILSTFRETVDKLSDGARVIIFPEHDEPHNHIVQGFQDRFVDVARLYWRKTGEALSFVPLYVAPRRRAMYLGEPVRFDPSAPPEQERRRICDAMMDRITELAVSLPPHTVVPYRKLPGTPYPTNHPIPEKEVSC